MSSFLPIIKTSTSLLGKKTVSPAEPLWKRVPTRDEDGGHLCDFMMLIPKFRSWPQDRAEQAICEIEAVFEQYEHAIVFADLNLKLNLLWVSMKPIPGLMSEIASAIMVRVPEARLVGNQVEVMAGAKLRR